MTQQKKLNYFLTFNSWSLLLQPIVENAVKHGVLAKVQGGTAKNTNDETIFIVEDGGMVMEEKFVETLLKDIHV